MSRFLIIVRHPRPCQRSTSRTTGVLHGTAGNGLGACTVQEGISRPFSVLPIVNEMGRTRLEVNVKLKANFSDKLYALNLVVTVPVPENTAKADIHTSLGARRRILLPRPSLTGKVSRATCERSAKIRLWIAETTIRMLRGLCAVVNMEVERCASSALPLPALL